MKNISGHDKANILLNALALASFLGAIIAAAGITTYNGRMLLAIILIGAAGLILNHVRVRNLDQEANQELADVILLPVSYQHDDLEAIN